MRNLLATLAVLILLALAGVYWFGRSGRSELAKSDRQEARTDSAPEPAAARARPVAGAPETAETTRAAVPLTAQERFGAWAPGAPRVLIGRVQLPAAVPADETLRVFALARRLSPDELFGQDGLVRGLSRSTVDRSSLPAALLAYEPVSSDGRFELSFPPDAETAWVALDGRFLTTPGCVEHAFDAGKLLLRPAIGAWVTGTVTLPADTEDPAAAFADVVVDLEPDSNQFSLTDLTGGRLFSRQADVDPEGHFELRAVDAGRPYEIDVESVELANWSRDGLMLEEGRRTDLQPRLHRGARLRGHVVDEAGHPVAGAEVAAVKLIMWGFPGEEVASTSSGADGSFDLAAIPPGKTAVVARLEGLLQSSVLELDLADDSESDGARLVLMTGSTLAGAVHTPTGEPVVGAKIRVKFDPQAMLGMAAMNAGRGAEGTTESDDEGGFTITGLGRGPFEVTATAPAAKVSPAGEGPDWIATQAGVAPDTRDLLLQLSAPAEVRGRVIDAEDRPVTAFAVIANSEGAVFFMPGEHRKKRVVHENGEFVLHGLKDGVWEIEVRAPGFGSSPPRELVLPQPGLEPLLIQLLPSAGVAGTVVGPGGEPVAGAKVTLQVESSKTFAGLTGRLELPQAHGDLDGKYLLEDLAVGRHSLVALHPDYAVSTPVQVEVQAGEVTTDVALTLRKGGTLTGELYDRSGERMAGAQIFVQDPSTWEMTLLRTEADGTFVVERIRPGSWQVTAMIGVIDPEAQDTDGGGGMSAFLENMRFSMVDIEEGKTTHVVLGAPPSDPVRVFGHVTHGGEPARAVTVSFLPEGGRGLAAMKIDQIDAEGRYEVELDEPGRYLVQVQSFGGVGIQQQNIEYPESIPEGDEHELDFELPTARIAGTVFGPDREPLAGARISLVSEGGVTTGTLMGGQFAELTTAGDGTYAFDYLRPGRYTVSAGGATFGGAFGAHSLHGRVVRESLAVKAGEGLSDVDFRLEAAGNITGSVRDATGARVQGAAIFVRDEHGRLTDRFSMITSGADGTFRYSGVAPGAYSVSGRVGGRINSEGVPVRVLAAESASVELVLETGTLLFVKVTDKSGGDVSNAKISVVNEDGHEFTGMVSYNEVMSGLGQGFKYDEMRVGPLAPSRYTVTATTPDGRSAKKSVTLDGKRAERKVKLRLK